MVPGSGEYEGVRGRACVCRATIVCAATSVTDKILCKLPAVMPL